MTADSQPGEAALLVHLGEVDARRLYLDEAFPSMFEYCVRQLGMEEGVAGNHCAEWIGAARHRSVREIRELIADRQPKPDVEASMRKQAIRGETPGVPALSSPTLPIPLAEEASRPPTTSVLTAPPAPAPPASARTSSASASRDQPLGGGRYSVKFMADKECHAALYELRALLRHEIPDGDLAVILKRAVSELLVKTRKRKFAELSGGGARKARKPVAPVQVPTEVAPRQSPSRHIPHAIRRAVSERGEGSCSFVSRSGRRCGSRDFLEFDHLVPWALHPQHSTPGIALRCRAHNQAAARAVFGNRHMDRYLRPSVRRPDAYDPDHVKRPDSG